MLKQITVLSGKGGTGKTSLVASFAAISRRIVVADCDVDAPNLHILLNPTILQTQEFIGSKLAEIDPKKCTACGLCVEKCKFNAINDFVVDPVLCEGCGTCLLICPSGGIHLKDRTSGYAYVSKIKYGLMSHARLNPGEENSGKLVTLVRQNARKIAEKENCELILNDGPPGIGCTVIASIGGIDLGLIVVEPTLSSIHDMERALKLLNHFKIKPGICINKYDINEDNTKEIVGFCKQKRIKIVGMIPFNLLVTEAMVAGKSVVEYFPRSKVTKVITKLWKSTFNYLDEKV